MTQKPLREAAQLLVDALQACADNEENPMDTRDALAAGRTALSLPDDPVGDNDAMQAAWLALRPEVGTAGWSTSDSCTYYGFFSHGWRARKQYAAPQPAEPKAAERQPLTPEQARVALDLEKPVPHCVMLDVRKVEAAHGIK